MIHPKYYQLKKQQEKLIKRKNKINKDLYNGIYERYLHPVVTRNHVPLEWRFDLALKTNPHFLERLMVNTTFNSGAIYFDGYHYLVVRLEGADRKSIFALAKSKSGIDNFRFLRLLEWEDKDKEEVNRYDMRLTTHEDGYIYGVYCAERKDTKVDDTSSAKAWIGMVKTKDLINWERLPNLETDSEQQRNAVLHPEFVNGKYAFYTRPQDKFMDVGSGGGIFFGYVKDMKNPVIEDERLVFGKNYHTIYEYKNGQGPAPIKTAKGWLHLVHGVRETAAGLRYVLYMFATDLNDLTKVIARPSGHFMAPLGKERVGDVSNVLFVNGWSIDGNKVFIYYASSDTRMHVATTTIEKLEDYVFNTPTEVYRAHDSTKQRNELINKNKKLLEDNK
ncbi:MAG: glycosidase [Acholeplasmatales bacterium]|jgi:4-O-beta-D-mannosyl-D-glucose phosphorylase|nr:glycosidase [Acholeplasmataceae bacterium]MCK9289080.1 glycosidase [Acholeplasmataceae bacterium]MCK9427381.1 glycosidase [Acholeplasmataceae bacterium]MDY0115846.1 glycosidase [Acholeplasmatales bacterium]